MAETTAFTMKLFINSFERRVLFAEASRDAVAFLHSLLVSPTTSIRLDDQTWHGCLDNVFDSLEVLDAAATRHRRRRPPSPGPGQQQARRFFLCAGDSRRAGCDAYVAGRSGARCPSCGGRMDAEAPRGAPGAGGSGQAAGAAAAEEEEEEEELKCILMDDLTVEPEPGAGLRMANAAASIAAMRGVPAAAFQEATVLLGYKEGLEILEASLQSSNVLTIVFLRDQNEKAPALELGPSSYRLDLGCMM